MIQEIKQIQQLDGATKESAYIDAYGFLRSKNNKISRIGVQTYNEPDGTIRRDLRLPEEVEKSIINFSLIPATLFHPDDEVVTAETSADHIIGFFGNLTYKDGFGWADVVITLKGALNAISHGIKQLSCGYTCDLERTPGVWIDELGLVGDVGQSYEYDCIQRNIKINHVALVPEGRAGENVALNLDSVDNEDSTDSLENLDVNNMDEVLVAIATLTTLVTAMQVQIADSVKEEVVIEPKQEIDNSEVINKEVKVRLDCLLKVNKLLPELVVDSALTTKQIKVKAISKLNPELAENLDDADESYINGMFAVLSIKPEVVAPTVELPEVTTDSTTNLKASLTDSRADATVKSDSASITARRKARSL